jgi:hypothetical protein
VSTDREASRPAVLSPRLHEPGNGLVTARLIGQYVESQHEFHRRISFTASDRGGIGRLGLGCVLVSNNERARRHPTALPFRARIARVPRQWLQEIG